MTVFSEFLAHFAFAQLLICGFLLLPFWFKNQSIRLFILLMFSGCGYILGDVLAPISPSSMLWWLSMIAGNALPGIFWLVSLSVFSDHLVLKRWQYWVASLTLLVPLTTAVLRHGLTIDIATYETFNGLTTYGAMLLELVLISHALIIALTHWRDDLVQQRRYIRGGVISVSACYIFFVIVVEELFKFQWYGIDFIKYSLLALLVTGINLLLFQLRSASLFETVKWVKAEKSATKIPSKELQVIIDAMTVNLLYQQDGLTIALLAKHLAIHEYKLRQLINKELQYRNFNDFLNFYRIKEVAEKLHQPSFKQVPVLTLALESGFRSLSSFNKAFKNTYGVTPTEYRKTPMNS